jgi:hypothetical protein
LREALRICEQVASALGYAHGGTAHYDLKVVGRTVGGSPELPSEWPSEWPSEGVAEREIRSDVGVDLDNVLGNLRRDLQQKSSVDLRARVAEIHNKISARLGEKALTPSRPSVPTRSGMTNFGCRSSFLGMPTAPILWSSDALAAVLSPTQSVGSTPRPVSDRRAGWAGIHGHLWSPSLVVEMARAGQSPDCVWMQAVAMAMRSTHLHRAASP